MSNQKESFKDRLREVVEYEGLTRKQLSEITGIKKDRWDNIFKGLTEPRISELEALSSIMPEYKLYLAFGDEEPRIGQLSPVTKRAFDSAALNSINEDQKSWKCSSIITAMNESSLNALIQTALHNGSPKEIHQLTRGYKKHSYEESIIEVGKYNKMILEGVGNFKISLEEAIENARMNDYLKFLKSQNKQ
jgi:transcriptional regulator with XRE-family HTH domain